ncbi:hypothetical protein JCM10914A_54800 [Paenibacillus sp. JCM 10914]|uniref:flagellar hook capping FlgD N-terminal domain-containing protein n=1 Tax=Paenibacillus sp. JCM 10914 TaxID=1236974 RepID=UPI0003CC7EF2|nr:flagellar hook capping FlgD N-terminal domain-containing protein [Paenibacillus sp. JCM 10914]GAE04778.1 flagellar basal-body rod modification protein FlgD [Paenibacillus sp. JCM 10914]
MATNPVSMNNMWPNYSKGNISNKGEKSQELGKDQFLSILITQLRHQDPLQPMQDREFISQMAQFTSLEQLMNINTQLTAMSQSLGAASSLIGKQISWLYKPDNGSENTQMKTGIVDSIIVRDGVHYAKVGESEVSLDQVLKIENPVPETNDPSDPGPTEPEPDHSEPSDSDANDPEQGEDATGGTTP